MEVDPPNRTFAGALVAAHAASAKARGAVPDVDAAMRAAQDAKAAYEAAADQWTKVRALVGTRVGPQRGVQGVGTWCGRGYVSLAIDRRPKKPEHPFQLCPCAPKVQKAQKALEAAEECAAGLVVDLINASKDVGGDRCLTLPDGLEARLRSLEQEVNQAVTGTARGRVVMAGSPADKNGKRARSPPIPFCDVTAVRGYTYKEWVKHEQGRNRPTPSKSQFLKWLEQELGSDGYAKWKSARAVVGELHRRDRVEAAFKKVRGGGLDDAE